MTGARRVLVIAGAVLALAAGAVAAAAAFIPGERVARVVAARAGAFLGAPVRIDDVGLRLLPLPGIRLSGIEVGDSSPLARVDEVDLRARILPLFRGRVVVSRLALRRPRVILEMDSIGQLNVPLGRGGGEGEDGGRDVAFAVEGVVIESGRLAYRDRRDGAVVRLDDWSQSLAMEGTVRGGRLETVSLTGWVAVEDVDARLPGVVLPVRDLRLRIAHEAVLDRATDRLHVRSLDVTLDGMTVAGAGRIDSVSTPARTAALRLAAEGLDAAALLEWVPDSARARLVLPDGRPLEVRGSMAVEAAVDGPLSADALPDVRGTFTLSDVSLAAGEPLITGLSGRGSFALDTVTARLEGRLLEAPLEATIAIGQPAAPVTAVDLRGRIDVGRLAALGVSDTLGLSGTLALDLRARVPAADPARATLSGTVGLSALEAAGADPVVRLGDGTIRFDGRGLALGPLRVRLGPDRVPLVVGLVADPWVPALLGRAAPAPTVALTLEADTLDLDALLDPAGGGYAPVLFARLRDRPLDGRSAGQVAEELGFLLPALPSVEGVATAAVGLIRRRGLEYRNLDARARLTPRAVDIERLSFGLMGGRVQLTGRLEPVAVDSSDRVTRARLVGQYSMNGVGAGPFFDRLTPFRDHLTGSLDLAGTLEATLDRNVLPDRETIGASGTVNSAPSGGSSWKSRSSWSTATAVAGSKGSESGKQIASQSSS